MWPSEVREKILQAHVEVAGLLDEVEGEAHRLLEGGGDFGTLRRLAFSLERSIGSLIEKEQELLKPTLESTDSWGEVRAEQLERAHERQRQALAESREASEQGRLHPRRFAEIVSDAVVEIRADMEKVERRSLGQELLRDDLVTVGPAS